MLKNYLKTSLRSLIRQRSYTVINILGLAIGLVTSILIFLWIVDELSFDGFHANNPRIYKVLLNNAYPDGKIETVPAVPARLKDVISSEIPEVELATQYSMETELLVKYGAQGYNESGLYSDANLFQIFSFPILKGNTAMPLTDIKSVAISDRLANKLFGSDDPMGKSLYVGQSHELTVSSVFATIPRHSTLQFDFVASFELFTKENPWTQHWKSGGTRTTVLLRSPELAGVANTRLAKLIKKNCADCSSTPFLFSYAKSRLYGEFENGINTGGRIQQIYLFGAAAILILLMACINFTNLSTARATARSREVGVRKSIGAQRKSLVFQFISESVLISFIALLFALVIVQLLLPFFNEVTRKSIELDFSNPVFIAGIVGITMLCGLLAGSYPAFVLSGFDAARVLKGSAHPGGGGNTLRKSLVVVQFVSSIILVVGSIAVYRQIVFIGEKNLGFEKENVIVVDQNDGIVNSYSAIKNELMQLRSVKSIAFGGNNIFTVPITTTDPVWPGKPENSSILFKIYRCDADFIPTMNIKMQRGRNFSDEGDRSNYIINEKAAELMGLTAGNAPGSELEMWNGKGKIIGVTDNFHNDNLKFGIQPMIFMYSEHVGLHYFIKVGTELPVAESISQIEQVFAKHNPDYPFEYVFLDDVYKREYESEAVIGKLSLSFTIVAVLISCLGLFGLASFIIERRTRELAVRKVMGASVANIVMMLCSNFAALTLISLLIALPVSWYIIREYLSNYTFHTEVHWSVYFLASMSMLLIVLFTVGLQSGRAAISNPVDSLRKE